MKKASGTYADRSNAMDLRKEKDRWKGGVIDSR